VVWLVMFAWIRAHVKAGLLDDPDQQKMQANKERPIMHLSDNLV